MTFRQRLMVYAMDLDLTTRLFGHDMFAPILVGPVARQGELHPDGELATARGASAAKAVMVGHAAVEPADRRGGRGERRAGLVPALRRRG